MRAGWRRVFVAVVLLVTSCAVAPLYEKAEIKKGWDKHTGLMYQDVTARYSTPSWDHPESEYTRWQYVRLDIQQIYGFGTRFALAPRSSVAFVRQRDLETDGMWDYSLGIDAGLGLKTMIYTCRSFSLSAKYDFGLFNPLGNVFLLVGLRKNNIERLTVSVYTSAIFEWEATRVTASGLNVAYHFSDMTLVAGSNFFFVQDLSREAEPYITFWVGVGL